jgi:hypothetical protein
MSAELVSSTRIWECSMCPETAVGVSWRSLADRGWTSHPAGELQPIRLCTACAEIIANRRGAAFEMSI